MIVKKKRIAIIFCIFLVFFFMTVFNGSFELVAPSFRIVVISAALFLFFSIIFYNYGFKGAVSFVIPYVIAFLVLEAGVHVWVSNFTSPATRAAFLTPFSGIKSFGVKSTYVPHHYTLYNLRPNLKKDDGTTHNKFGLRDNRNFEIPSTATKIVFIGGSTTYTVGLKDNKDIFSFRLEKLLNAYYKETTFDNNIQVVNAGMPGATSAENLLRLIFFVSEIKPDLVVIQHGLNDIWPRIRENITTDFSNYRKIYENPDYLRKAPLVYSVLRKVIENSVVLTFISRKFGIIPQVSIGDMVTRKDVLHGTRFLSTNGTEYFERNTRYMIAVCRAMGAHVLLATEAYSKDAKSARLMAMPEHNAVVSMIAKEENVIFYDFNEEMLKEKKYMPDGRHLNQAGSDLKADLFYTFFIRNNILQTLKQE